MSSRHCFNNIADSTDNLLSLTSMDVVALDTTQSGVMPHISIAGACSTATHGSGEKNGNLATAVSGLELVTASGEVVKLSRRQDGEAFLGAVVGLGALGVITKITLDVQPTFMMRQYVYENVPLAEVP